jgi:hypothetical protein
MMENIQRWYLQDKEQSLQEEFEALLDEWSGKTQTAKSEPSAAAGGLS